MNGWQTSGVVCQALEARGLARAGSARERGACCCAAWVRTPGVLVRNVVSLGGGWLGAAGLNRRTGRTGRTIFKALEDFAHGFVESQAKNRNQEVDRVAGAVTFRPAPVRFFYYQARVILQEEISCFARKNQDLSALEQRGDGGLARGADLFSCPARGGRGLR